MLKLTPTERIALAAIATLLPAILWAIATIA